MSKQPHNKPLKILNASAGSGKTYRLVQEYIELLIGENTSPTQFKHLIAMTFTNKAALEMKERIIQGLDGISNNDSSKESLKSSIAKNVGIKPQEVVSRCQKALESILHQYEDFHVMTIDKFNLKLIRSFSRDLDIPGEFEVVLDESELIEKVVDDLLNQLGNEDQKRLNKLMIGYAKSNLDEEKTWNFRRNLIEFGSILKNERHHTGIEKLLEMELTVERYNELYAIQKNIDNKYADLVGNLKTEIDNIDPDTIPGKSSTIKQVNTIINDGKFLVRKHLIGPQLRGYLEKEDGEKVIPRTIKECFEELEPFWNDTIQEYVGVQLFLKNYFNMALLQYMARALRDSRNESQLIRISEFNSLISGLIQNEKAPFIYERLGTRYHHYLLDEFQDTSHLQWLNLVPLVHESIGQNHENLIVGDPKQSIYRFKNGIAEQFVELPAIYNPSNDPHIAETSSIFENMGAIENLEDNWRSSPTIVNFNNSFFETFKSSLPDSTVNFYSSVSQNPKSTKNGIVSIESYENKDSDEALIQQVTEWIETCIKDGYSPSELCILGRRNKDCNNWAIALDRAGYKVVSADSLLIDSSAEVRLTIAFLKWRLKPSGKSEKKQFCELYLRLKHESALPSVPKISSGKTTDNGHRYRDFDDDSFLRDYFGNKESFFFKYEHIYDLIQGFFNIAELHELENPYLHHLADWAHDFGLKKGPNLALFINDYEREKGKIAVQIPEAEDAINIMTIHKSKGLEFPVVMLPSWDFDLQIKGNFLVGWNDFLIYKRPAEKDVLEPLIDLFNHEKSQILTDIVNLCYVGMTRPVERLYIRNVFNKKTFGSLFHDVLNKSGLGTSENEKIIVNTTDGPRTTMEEQNYGLLFHPSDISDRLWFPHIAFQDSEELKEQNYLNEEVQFGVAFHLLASRIKCSEDIRKEVKWAQSEGVVSNDQLLRLEESLTVLWSNSNFLKIVNDSEKHLAEQSILLTNGETIRIDAIFLSEERTIILDYKTGLPKEKDVKQVKEYQKALEEMGYPDVQSCLYYTANDEIRII